jgi:hypothetical protein
MRLRMDRRVFRLRLVIAAVTRRLRGLNRGSRGGHAERHEQQREKRQHAEGKCGHWRSIRRPILARQ